MKNTPTQVMPAVIEHDRDILCVRRRPNKHDYIAFEWEFPGGQLKKGQFERDVLYWEIKEELTMEADTCNLEMVLTVLFCELSEP